MLESVLWVISKEKNLDLDGEIRGSHHLHVFGSRFELADFVVDAKLGLETIKLLLAASIVTAYGNECRPAVLSRYEILAHIAP